jgi:hypothetical protein
VARVRGGSSVSDCRQRQYEPVVLVVVDHEGDVLCRRAEAAASLSRS